MEILTYISAHCVQWLFAAAVAVLGWGYRIVSARLKAEQERNTAIAEGVQALLRDSIVSSYNKYSERGACPIYAKESVKKAYAAYHQLGGNDVATELYQKILKMKEDSDD